MSTDEMIYVGTCPCCGALAQAIDTGDTASPVRYRYVPTSNDEPVSQPTQMPLGLEHAP